MTEPDSSAAALRAYTYIRHHDLEHLAKRLPNGDSDFLAYPVVLDGVVRNAMADRLDDELFCNGRLVDTARAPTHVDDA